MFDLEELSDPCSHAHSRNRALQVPDKVDARPEPILGGRLGSPRAGTRGLPRMRGRSHLAAVISAPPIYVLFMNLHIVEVNSSSTNSDALHHSLTEKKRHPDAK